METKHCKKCNRILPLADFSKNKSCKDGLQTSCKFCMKKMNAKHYQSSYKDRQQELNKINRDKLRKVIFKIKQTNPCPCGESNPVCLDFHHFHDKDANISRMLSNTLGIEKALGEIAKCCVICSNCHRKIHAGSELPFDEAVLEPLVSVVTTYWKFELDK